MIKTENTDLTFFLHNLRRAALTCGLGAIVHLRPISGGSLDADMPQ